MEDTEKVKYSINDNIIIRLEKNDIQCRAKIIFDANLYTIDDVGTTKEFKSSNGTLLIYFKDVKSYKEVFKMHGKEFKGGSLSKKDDKIVFETVWKRFDYRWRKKQYNELEDFITLKLFNNKIRRLTLTTPKNKYIPKDWEGSYESFKRNKLIEMNSRKRSGYVSNRTKADYVYNNLHNPFSGGGASGK